MDRQTDRHTGRRANGQIEMISHTYGAEIEMCIIMKQTKARIQIKRINKQIDRQTNGQTGTDVVAYREAHRPANA